MELVCEKCNRVLKNGRWSDDLPPIHRTAMTICPDCLKKNTDDAHKRDSNVEGHIQTR